MAVQGDYEVGILMSTDTDLKPALEGQRGRRLAISTRNLYCHWLGKDAYEGVANETDYSD